MHISYFLLWLLKKDASIYLEMGSFKQSTLAQDLLSYIFHQHGTHLQSNISIFEFNHSVFSIILVWSVCCWWQFCPLNFFSKYKSCYQSQTFFFNVTVGFFFNCGVFKVNFIRAGFSSFLTVPPFIAITTLPSIR